MHAPRRYDTTTPPTRRSLTPWGYADTAYELADGIIAVSTPSHGGLWLSPERYAQIPDTLKSVASRYAGAPWFEEDCDAIIVGFIFREELKTHHEPAVRAWVDASVRMMFFRLRSYYGCFGYKPAETIAYQFGINPSNVEPMERAR